MAQKTSLAQLDNDEFIETWNSHLTNKQVAEKLNASWTLIVTKATRVKAVRDALTVSRPGGISGTYQEKDTAAEAVAATTSTVVRSSAVAASQGLHVHVQIMSSGATLQTEADITGANTEDVVAEMHRLMSSNRINKADLYRNGQSIAPSEIQDGDTLVIRPAIFNA
jgi:hypothetical protein